ncbi:hypothetical protein BCR42DRAFT_328549 [Absidia repens]|uniref:Uncharacterized protein n=1 Tax=Absidia repens TaxID=90262 RepID=A0A1X2IEG8_9FUNG|nr:hypothetical protein BCR42DRAFT_328549 [Absidia repens]
MILLILYYVYKWVTVPWSYYESARSRRMNHFNATYNHSPASTSASSSSSTTAATPDDGQKGRAARGRQEQVANELRLHELIGLISVLASPVVAGYTLQYSRYFLSDYDRYMSSFNVGVFVLAASLKPLSHVMLLLRERTVYLQSEIQVNETHVQRLQTKLDMMEDELDALKEAFATKGDLDQVADDFNPALMQLSEAIRRSKKKEQLLHSWSKDKFTLIDEKVKGFEEYICYKVEQEQQRLAKNWTITTLVLLPLVWMIKLVTSLLPLPHALLGAAPNATTATTTTANTTTTRSSTASFDLPPLPPNSSLSGNHHHPSHKHLTHRSSSSSSSSLRGRSSDAVTASGKHFAHSDLLSCPSTPDPTSNTVY